METAFVKVEDVMQSSVHMISGLASLKDAITEMSHQNVSSVVIDRRHDGDEYGVLTVVDIATYAIAKSRSLERTNVYEIMTKPTLTLDPKMNVKYAVRLLSRLGHRRALVTNENGLLGSVTIRDLVLSYADQETTGP